MGTIFQQSLAAILFSGVAQALVIAFGFTNTPATIAGMLLSGLFLLEWARHNSSSSPQENFRTEYGCIPISVFIGTALVWSLRMYMHI